MMSLEELEQQREERGLVIAKKQAQINCVEEDFYTVLSQSGNGEYAITKVDDEWICECPDNKFRHVKCKHIFAVELSLKMKSVVKKSVVIQEINVRLVFSVTQRTLRSLAFVITKLETFSVLSVLTAIRHSA